MEDYLQYLKTLRSQISDAEDQAAKISVEEHMQMTTVQNLAKDLESAKSEIKTLKEETDQMINERGKICTKISEKQKAIACLEIDSYTLYQTLELIQQERVTLSVKLAEKSTYYNKVGEDINTKLQEQQDWINSYNNSTAFQHNMVKLKGDNEKGQKGENVGIGNLFTVNPDDDASLGYASSMLESVIHKKSRLISERRKVQESIDRVKSRINEFKLEPRGMDINIMEEELKALLLDKSGENEYFLSLKQQIKKLKDISHVIKCTCEEYKIELDRLV